MVCVFVSISEEEPGPLRSDTEGRGGPKISRTFSYLRSKMSKKGKVRTVTAVCTHMQVLNCACAKFTLELLMVLIYLLMMNITSLWQRASNVSSVGLVCPLS